MLKKNALRSLLQGIPAIKFNLQEKNEKWQNESLRQRLTSFCT